MGSGKVNWGKLSAEQGLLSECVCEGQPWGKEKAGIAVSKRSRS